MKLKIVALMLLAPLTACLAAPQGGIKYWSLAIKWEFPIVFDHKSGYEPHKPPIIEDVDSDGSPEVIVHGLAPGFIVLDGSTGKEEWRKELPGYAVLVANLDSDPQKEILLYDPRLYCIDGRTGEVQWSFTAKSITFDPLLADLDGDGVKEIIGLSRRGIYIISSDGKLEGAISIPNGIYWPLGYAAGDVDGDGREEFLLSRGSEILVFKGASLFRKYEIEPGYRITSLTLADLDGEGSKELVITSTSGIGKREGELWVLNGDGKLVWRKDFQFEVTAPCLTDLNGDGALELVFGLTSFSLAATTGNLTALDKEGNVIWSSPSSVMAKPTCADIDGDGEVEVLATDLGGDLISVGGEDGSLEWSVWLLAIETPSVGDVDGDGKLEVVVSSGQDEVYCLDGAKVHLHVSKEDGGLLVSWDFDMRPVNLYYPLKVRAKWGGLILAEVEATKPPVRLKLGQGEYDVELLYENEVITRRHVRVGGLNMYVLAALLLIASMALLILLRKGLNIIKFSRAGTEARGRSSNS